GQLHLYLAVSPLALVCFGFRPLALGQIERERDDTIGLEHRRADQHGYAAAVLAPVLLLEWLNRPERLQVRARPRVPVAPFRRRHPGPMQATRSDVPTVVS